MTILTNADPATAAALWHLGLVSPEDVVDWAVSRADSNAPSQVAELAGVSNPTAADIDPLLDELVPDQQTALVSAQLAAQHVAYRFSTSGDMSALEAARLVARVVEAVPPSAESLGHFGAIVGEWEDDVANRAAYEQDIRLGLAELATLPPPTRSPSRPLAPEATSCSNKVARSSRAADRPR